MRQLSERGQLALLLLKKGFFGELLVKVQSFMENASEEPDVYYGIFYQPDHPGKELLLELIVETADNEQVEYECISLDAARMEGGKLFESFFSSIWGQKN